MAGEHARSVWGKDTAMSRTRSEHMEWCKQRAHELADSGQFQEAVTSMLSDINKHDETRMVGPMAAVLMMAALASPNRASIKRWIDGFN